METFGNHHDDEFEEVESPFSPSTPKSTLKKSTLRRPLGTFSSEPPLVVENKRAQLTAVSRLKYVDQDDEEEDEVVERKAVVRATPRKKIAKISWPKRVVWFVVALLSLRLISMDSGVYDHIRMGQVLSAKANELKMIKTENKEISLEIQKILYDNSYQKNLAKEHLGVISKDEFVILFAADSVGTSTKADRPL